jgi:hypothetical protein
MQAHILFKKAVQTVSVKDHKHSGTKFILHRLRTSILMGEPATGNGVKFFKRAKCIQHA